MEAAIKDTKFPIGRKIERIRNLRGFTQDELGASLGITKQAVSKLEQSDSIEEERLQQLADALGVTLKGLKNFSEELVLNNTNHFNDGSTVTNSSINNSYECTTVINNPVEKIIELYESLLQVEREKVEILQGKKN